MQTSTSDQIRATVRQSYGAVATQKQQSGCCGGGASCCGPTGSSSKQLGYIDPDLKLLRWSVPSYLARQGESS
jgi:uncharacterized protein (DUF779 family)